MGLDLNQYSQSLHCISKIRNILFSSIYLPLMFLYITHTLCANVHGYREKERQLHIVFLANRCLSAKMMVSNLRFVLCAYIPDLKS
jgi:hypothetical protein